MAARQKHELADPDYIGDYLVLQRESKVRKHRGDFYVHHDGFAFYAYVDLTIDVERGDEVIIVKDNTMLARGIVSSAETNDHLTEFFAVPETMLIDE